ncbi:hypothetical protein J6590_047614 [Homalodisca vitripennis]|nr:hypothetical protein J6590_047614 [Homalodisca vitripennis]
MRRKHILNPPPSGYEQEIISRVAANGTDLQLSISPQSRQSTVRDDQMELGAQSRLPQRPFERPFERAIQLQTTGARVLCYQTKAYNSSP